MMSPIAYPSENGSTGPKPNSCATCTQGATFHMGVLGCREPTRQGISWQSSVRFGITCRRPDQGFEPNTVAAAKPELATLLSAKKAPGRCPEAKTK